MSQPLLVVTSYCARDFSLAKLLYEWIADLDNGENKHHSVLLVCESTCPMDRRLELKAIAQKSFGFVGILPVATTSVFPPNAQFVAASKQIGDTMKQPWLWLEPDCTPIKRDWLDTLSDAYSKSPMKFMGPVIRQATQDGLPASHLTGTAIYSPDAWTLYHGKDDLMKQIVAWDIWAAGAALPRTQHTELIQHHFGEQDLPPTFVESRTENSPKNAVTLDFLKRDAVLFHRCKDASLIGLLRKKYGLKSQVPVNRAAEAVRESAGKSLALA